MKKENVFIADIYQIKETTTTIYFGQEDISSAAVNGDEILFAADVPVVKFGEFYVPLKFIPNLKEYVLLKSQTHSTISYEDSRFLDKNIHIFNCFNQKIVDNIRPAFKEPGNISLAKLNKYFAEQEMGDDLVL